MMDTACQRVLIDNDYLSDSDESDDAYEEDFAINGTKNHRILFKTNRFSIGKIQSIMSQMVLIDDAYQSDSEESDDAYEEDFAINVTKIIAVY